MKTLTNRQVAVLKRTAQNNYPLVQKMAKIDAQIEQLNEDKAILEAQIQGFEMGVMALTGGYKSSDLIKRVVLPAVDENGNQKVDKEGRALTVTKYVPIDGVLKEVDGGYVICEPEVVEPETTEVSASETVETQED